MTKLQERRWRGGKESNYDRKGQGKTLSLSFPLPLTLVFLDSNQDPGGCIWRLDDVFLRPGAQVADLYVRQAPKTIELDLSAALVYDAGATDERMEFIRWLTAFAIFPQIRIIADLTIRNPVMLDNRPVDEWAVGLTRQKEQEQRSVDDADKLP